MKRTEQKHLAILAAAKQEFLAHGFVAANMNNVCQQAEVSKRTLYRHFASKELLFEQVLLEIQQNEIGQEQYDFDPSASIESQLYQITLREIQILYQLYGIALSRTLVMEFFRQSELGKTVSQRISRGTVLTAWFHQAIQAGKLQAEHGEIISSVYLKLFQGTFFWPQVFDLKPQPEPDEIKQHAEFLTQIIIRAFAP